MIAAGGAEASDLVPLELRRLDKTPYEQEKTRITKRFGSQHALASAENICKSEEAGFVYPIALSRNGPSNFDISDTFIN